MLATRLLAFERFGAACFFNYSVIIQFRLSMRRIVARGRKICFDLRWKRLAQVDWALASRTSHKVNSFCYMPTNLFQMGHISSRSASSANILSADELTLVENLFKSMSRSSGSIKREDIFKHWSTHLDDVLLQFVVRFLCHEPGKRVSAVNGENFGRLYVFAVRGSPEERTSLIFDGFSEEDQRHEIPTATFLQYVQATINSYLRLQKNSGNSHYSTWSSIGCTVNNRRIGMRSRSLCEDIVKYGDSLNTNQIENWFAAAATFKTIQSHVFQCLFLVSQKKGDKNTSSRINDLNLLPVCRGLENIPHFPSILGLGDVLFLNLSLPHELRNEWR